MRCRVAAAGGYRTTPYPTPYYPQKKAGAYRKYPSIYFLRTKLGNWGHNVQGMHIQCIVSLLPSRLPPRQLMARGMPYSGPEIIVRTSNRDIDFTYIIHTYLTSIIKGNRYTVPNYHLVVT